MDSTRIDKWLWAARFFKTRSLATDAVNRGQVQVAQQNTKPSKDIRVGDVLTSAEALPAGDGYLIVVQIKANPAGKTQNFRITYHAERCGECQRAEYACTCEHAGEEEDGQAH